jgi:hypothetical protein
MYLLNLRGLTFFSNLDAVSLVTDWRAADSHLINLCRCPPSDLGQDEPRNGNDDETCAAKEQASLHPPSCRPSDHEGYAV